MGYTLERGQAGVRVVREAVGWTLVTVGTALGVFGVSGMLWVWWRDHKYFGPGHDDENPGC